MYTVLQNQAIIQELEEKYQEILAEFQERPLLAKFSHATKPFRGLIVFGLGQCINPAIVIYKLHYMIKHVCIRS